MLPVSGDMGARAQACLPSRVLINSSFTCLSVELSADFKEREAQVVGQDARGSSDTLDRSSAACAPSQCLYKGVLIRLYPTVRGHTPTAEPARRSGAQRLSKGRCLGAL